MMEIMHRSEDDGRREINQVKVAWVRTLTATASPRVPRIYSSCQRRPPHRASSTYKCHPLEAVGWDTTWLLHSHGLESTVGSSSGHGSMHDHRNRGGDQTTAPTAAYPYPEMCHPRAATSLPVIASPELRRRSNDPVLAPTLFPHLCLRMMHSGDQIDHEARSLGTSVMTHDGDRLLVQLCGRQ